jgi:CheY-like chemotaxis protein
MTRILVVDDDEPVRNAMRALFGCLGCEVVDAADGVQALALIRAEPTRFELVIVDSRMPGMSGPEVCQKAHAIAPDVPLVLCSGAPHDLTRLEGVRDLLPKPFGLKDARALLTRHGLTPAI